MAELQSFGDRVAVVDAPAPRNLGSSTGQGLALLGDAVSAAGVAVDSRNSRKAAQAEANAVAGVAAGYIESEAFKRKEPLQEAVEQGHLTVEQAKLFGSNEAESLAALNKAAGKGMNSSIKNALARSVKYQFAAIKNPGAAKELATAYGIRNNSIEQDTLGAIEKIEREQLEADADYVRELANNEGYTEFLNKSNEEVLDMWQGSPAAARDRQIKQDQRSALSQEASISERAPSASRAMALQLSGIAREMAQVQMAYTQARGSDKLGSDRGDMGLAEHLNLWAEEKISEASATYSDFPKLVDTLATSVRASVNAKLAAKKKGMELGAQEYAAAVTRPMEQERLRLQVEQAKWTASQNPVRALQNVINFKESVSNFEVRMAKLADEVSNDPTAANLATFMEKPENVQLLSILRADAAEEGTLMIERLLTPDAAAHKDAANAAAMTIQSMSRTDGVAGDEAGMKTAVMNMLAAYEMNTQMSPSKAAVMEEAILGLAQDPRFVQTVQGSPAARKLVVPYSEGIKKEIISSMQNSMNKATSQRVSSFGKPDLPGSREMRFALWRKMGQYMVLDPARTNEAGVPQYKLVNNVEEALSAEDIAAQQEALNEYNQDLLRDTSADKYTLLKNMTGATSVAKAVSYIIESSEGISLSTLSPTRTIEARDPEAIEADTKEPEAPLTSRRQTQ